MTTTTAAAVGGIYREWPGIGGETVQVLDTDERTALVFSQADGSTRHIPHDTLTDVRQWLPVRRRPAVKA